MADLSDLTIGIIGGAGRMGAFFLPQLQELGYKNLLFSDADEQKAHELEARFKMTSNEDLAARCDLSIISVPPSKIVEVAKEIGPHIKKGALASHFGSVQLPGLEALASCPGYDVIGLHLMFSNTVKSMRERNVAMIPYRGDGVWLETLQQLLSPTGANLRVINPPEKHDRLMVCMQALLHLNTFVLTMVLREYKGRYGITMADLDLFETPNLLLTRIGMGRIYRTDNPALYAGIQMENPAVPEMLAIYGEAFGKLSDFITHGKVDHFANTFRKLAKYFGSIHTAWSAAASDEIIEFLKKMGTYSSLVEKREGSVREYYAGQYRQSLEDAGCVGEEFIHPKLRKVGGKYLGIAKCLEEEDYAGARELAGSLMHSAELNKIYFRRGHSLVITCSNEFMRLCDLVIDAINEMPYFHPNSNNGILR